MLVVVSTALLVFFFSEQHGRTRLIKLFKEREGKCARFCGENESFFLTVFPRRRRRRNIYIEEEEEEEDKEEVFLRREERKLYYNAKPIF